MADVGNFWLFVILTVYLAAAAALIYVVYLVIRALRKYLRSQRTQASDEGVPPSAVRETA